VLLEATEDQAMDHKAFSLAAGIIFALVSLAHLLRVCMAWPVMIGGWAAPMWLSFIAVIGAGGLSYFGLRLAKHN
jgi:hypothetical protein